MSQPIQDITRTYNEPIPNEVVLGVTLKEQMVSAPATGTRAVFAVVLAPKDESGAWMQGKDELTRIEDEPDCPHPLLAKLASLLQLMQFMARIDTSVPQVAALRGFILQNYNVDIAGLSLWDAAKALDPVLPQMLAAQKAAMPQQAPMVPPSPEMGEDA
jgi:hypothetical protein